MELIIEKEKEVCVDDIEVGDIVVCETDIYIITKYNHQYQAQHISGEGGAVGRHDSIEYLRKAISKYVTAIYPSSQYQLVLTKV